MTGGKLRSGIARHGLKRYFQREATRHYNRIVRPVRKNALVAKLRRLGLEAGVTVCVHSSLARLGYVVGGPMTLIEAVREVVGDSGRILMPSFPTGASMASWLEAGKVFDVRSSPSNVGLVTEVFRRYPGVVRSLHPTNSVAGMGPGIEELLDGHVTSKTPFGPESPYGRLAKLDDSFILMVETHVQSFLHHLQERVNFPTLFLDEHADGRVLDAEGREHVVRTRIMRPRVPYYVAVPGTGSKPDWAILHDFALVMPRRRFRLLRQHGMTFDGYPRIRERPTILEKQGALSVTKIGAGVVGLLRVRPFVDHIQPEFEELVDQFRSWYDPEAIAALNMPYF